MVRSSANTGEKEDSIMRLIVICAAAALLVAAGVASATPGSGVTAPVLARGLLGEQLKLKIKKKDRSDVVVQQLTIAPGGHTGWHTHPGVVVVVVKAGTLTFYSADDPTCTGIDYDAGEAFVDEGHGHVHIARNEGATNLELYATYFEVPPGGLFRLDVPAPGNCPF
jgi:quercetin dioxygenase-like cupin family protein